MNSQGNESAFQMKTFNFHSTLLLAAMALAPSAHAGTVAFQWTTNTIMDAYDAAIQNTANSLPEMFRPTVLANQLDHAAIFDVYARPIDVGVSASNPYGSLTSPLGGNVANEWGATQGSAPSTDSTGSYWWARFYDKGNHPSLDGSTGRDEITYVSRISDSVSIAQDWATPSYSQTDTGFRMAGNALWGVNLDMPGVDIGDSVRWLFVVRSVQVGDTASFRSSSLGSIGTVLTKPAEFSFEISTVATPEPGSFVLFGAGSLLVAAVRFRQSRMNKALKG